MTYSKIVFAALGFPLIFHSSYGQNSGKEQQTAKLLLRVIQLNHYQPKPVDDKFSQTFYDEFVKRVTAEDLTLSNDDLKLLSAYRNSIDDELNGKEWKFLDLARSMISENAKKAKPESASEIDKESLFDLYCDILSNTFDPHTEYMPMHEKEEFESQLSTEGYFYGFSLSENDKQETEIEKLVPGSSAWKSGDLNKGDVLLKIALESSAAVDVSKFNPEQISNILASQKNSKLTLTVRKANGIEKNVTIAKEKIRNDENAVKSFVLSGAEKIGYIYLPDFYTTLNGSTGSCANDVAKEIVKLKKENIQGLILDVRYNGGGSLEEALDLAGIFIDAGPLCLIRDKEGKSYTLKDPHKGTIFDGPMVLLLNGQSASASELLGAVLQDYHRAVVVGSASYGKGTAQVILPLDTTDSQNREAENGFVKVTISKFYRISGLTTQNTGVVPDIVLPDFFDGLNYHESASYCALPADTIKKNPYYAPLAELPLEALRGKSSVRVASDSQFNYVKKYSELLRKHEKISKIEEPAMPRTSLFAASNNSLDRTKIESDTYYSDLNKAWLDKIDRDFYIKEGYQVLNDLIQIKTH